MKKSKRYLGVDLHRTQFTVCERNEKGEEKLCRYHIKELEEFASKLDRNVEIAVEATGNTKFFCDVVKKKAGKLVVINPHQFKVISKSVKKTDENDAKTIALFLEKDMLPEIRMKDDLHAKISSLVQTREKLVRLRTALKNKINNIFSSNMMPLEKESMSSEKGLRKILSATFDPITDVELRVMVSEIRNLNNSIKELDDAIAENGNKLEGHKNLTSIKGIGDKGSAILLSVIGNVHDFSNKNKLAAYFGIVPRVSNSNETVHHGRITKNGSKIGRSTLVQCSLIAKRYCKPLRDYHERIKSRRGGGKVNIALARKFLDIIYYTLKNDKVFEDFPTFKLVES
ncbi:MAG: IS110 family transposase [Lentisphaerae bacterium GWF2_45_14]|nr:MAG: IS110 family transposase [Lentisphaerae bacterium GWF2_45_14]